MNRLSQILKLRPPSWDAVKRNCKSDINSKSGIIWVIIAGVAALGMAAALFLPENEIIYFFGNYGLACFFPVLTVLLIRRWNRTLAFPVSLIYTAIAVVTLFFDLSFNGILTTLFIVVPLVIAASSDRISFIYKWKAPFNYIGLAVLSVLLFFALYVAVIVLFFSVLMAVILIALFILMIRSLFGYRRYGRWY